MEIANRKIGGDRPAKAYSVRSKRNINDQRGAIWVGKNWVMKVNRGQIEMFLPISKKQKT